MLTLKFNSFILRKGQGCGAPIELLLCPLICAIGFALGQSTIKLFHRGSIGICTYACLIAHAATGKTPIQGVVLSAIQKVINYKRNPNEGSPLTNADSIERLVTHLDLIKSHVMIGKVFFLLK
jgi:hypothetical protein